MLTLCEMNDINHLVWTHIIIHALIVIQTQMNVARPERWENT